MAGGKLTPRQKMINLMYLVFIAMLALNMSKEVLSAFGLMNEKFEGANVASNASNAQLLGALDKKASESKGDFIAAASTAHKVENITKSLYTYIDGLKSNVLKDTKIDEKTGKLPYEAMDKGQNLDELWFSPSGYSDKGKEVVTTIEKFKADMKSVLGSDSKYKAVLAEVNKKFDLGKVKNKDGVQVDYLDYHFKGFPAVASLAKLSAWQNDVKKAETDVYNALLGKAAVSEASYSKFEAIVVLDKNAYFQGETVTGKVVLGKYDPNAEFTGFKGPGKLVNGQAVLSMTAGGVGEQNIGGSFNFMEDGKPINLPFKGTYVVVPKPNSATISADKMNVVYRGVTNPISISFAGIGEDKVSASAPGLSPAGGKGKYNMNPGQGNETTIVVTGKLPNGQSVSDKKTFRIKAIPAPQGAIAGATGIIKGTKSRLEVCQISAILQDFDFELNLRVVQFSLKAPGQPTVIVNGDRVNSQCKNALARVTRGDQVTISEIKTKLEGSDLILRQTSPVIYEIQ
jgi:gliding motility-associated protein GldM